MTQPTNLESKGKPTSNETNCDCGQTSCPAMTDDTQMCSYPDPGDYACTAQRSGDEDCICG
ncbi:hypothetical protein ABIE52_006923 [Rhodococcus sp. OAS809]